MLSIAFSASFTASSSSSFVALGSSPIATFTTSFTIATGVKAALIVALKMSGKKLILWIVNIDGCQNENDQCEDLAHVVEALILEAKAVYPAGILTDVKRVLFTGDVQG